MFVACDGIVCVCFLGFSVCFGVWIVCVASLLCVAFVVSLVRVGVVSVCVFVLCA